MPGIDPTTPSISAPAVRGIDLTCGQLLSVLLSLDPSRRVAILDSGGARDPEARFLIAGFDPFEVVESYGDELHIKNRHDNFTTGTDWLNEDAPRVVRGSALALLDERLARYRVAFPSFYNSHLPAHGACIATFSYNLVRRLERLRSRQPLAPSTTSVEPDVVLAFYDTLVIHDYTRGETFTVSVGGNERLDEARDAFTCAASKHESLTREERRSRAANIEKGERASNFARTSNFTRDEYLAAVRRIKEHIFAGDIYQANLTQQITCPLLSGLTAEEVFVRLRCGHPASFAAFLRRSEDVVVSASPERFLRVGAGDESGRVIEAWPIKGTRRRGRDAEEDARLRAELLASEKDRAENVMIVDLLRNDLGRVCHFGSIEVTELCALQEHPTLFHLVSKVRGRLREDATAGRIIRAAFPCGSITGAPKIRAMEIIDEIETAPRGLSMGSIGYFSFDGRTDLSVAIRTMTIRENTARFNVGGGIVADSDPAQEYEESLLKARALLRALDASM
ncbi:MAG TPA: aminodeoxychorismate synthase component I [Pyrinomonadaceae bacterium]|jgi:para-aminobenzoate synthetase component 1|nr:aminodeoxychorismate synthase component I [Pyrinomonadaceae bacterium]